MADTITHDMMLRLALKYVKQGREAEREYEEAREDAYRHGLNFPYCKHGTFIGDPYGADYLCGYCESGEDTDLYATSLALAKNATKDDQETIAAIDSLIGNVIGTIARHRELRQDDDLYMAAIDLNRALTQRRKAILAKYGKGY